MTQTPTDEITREAFMSCCTADDLTWTTSKKGNLFVRCWGHTYTLVGSGLRYRAVVVGPGGRRVDVVEQPSLSAVLEVLWPLGAARPLSTKVG